MQGGWYQGRSSRYRRAISLEDAETYEHDKHRSRRYVSDTTPYEDRRYVSYARPRRAPSHWSTIAAELDAADGVMDGTFFGHPIVERFQEPPTRHLRPSYPSTASYSPSRRLRAEVVPPPTFTDSPVVNHTSTAATLDAADGVMDGKFFGHPIVERFPAPRTTPARFRTRSVPTRRYPDLDVVDGVVDNTVYGQPILEHATTSSYMNSSHAYHTSTNASDGIVDGHPALEQFSASPPPPSSVLAPRPIAASSLITTPASSQVVSRFRYRDPEPVSRYRYRDPEPVSRYQYRDPNATPSLVTAQSSVLRRYSTGSFPVSATPLSSMPVVASSPITSTPVTLDSQWRTGTPAPGSSCVTSIPLKSDPLPPEEFPTTAPLPPGTLVSPSPLPVTPVTKPSVSTPPVPELVSASSPIYPEIPVHFPLPQPSNLPIMLRRFSTGSLPHLERGLSYVPTAATQAPQFQTDLAKSLDAADGCLDGTFFGHPIVERCAWVSRIPPESPTSAMPYTRIAAPIGLPSVDAYTTNAGFPIGGNVYDPSYWGFGVSAMPMVTPQYSFMPFPLQPPQMTVGVAYQTPDMGNSGSAQVNGNTTELD